MDLNQPQLAEQLGITREWLSKLETGDREVSELIRIKIERLEKENLVHAPVRLKTGGKAAGVVEEPADRYDAVASRLEFKKKMPSRADCEAHLKQVLDAAEAEGSPENVPVIYHRLKKQLPLDEWARPPETVE